MCATGRSFAHREEEIRLQVRIPFTKNKHIDYSHVMDLHNGWIMVHKFSRTFGQISKPKLLVAYFQHEIGISEEGE